MIVELVSTGTELLLGEIVNTNSVFLAQRLNELGFNVLYQTTVGDNRDRMAQVLKTALSRADIVITSGGLGPTQGDITKEVAADLFAVPLVLDQISLDRIVAFFERRKLVMSANNERQAMIPEGSIAIPNERGTAPGVIFEQGEKTVIHLPGPPFELEHMVDVSLIPYLKERFGQQGVIVSKILRTYGIGESYLEEQIRDYILGQTNPTLALLVRSGEVIIRLTAKAPSPEQADQLIGCLEAKIRDRLHEYIFGVNDDTLESVVGQLLTAKKATVALAESCTGGLVSNRLTDVAGSSVYFKGSVVCYSNEVKIKELGVRESTLTTEGAVSESTACQMAEGIRHRFASDIGIGITGIAGPGGATATKPVGLVYIALASEQGTKCLEYRFAGIRKEIKTRSALAALNQLYRYVLTI